MNKILWICSVLLFVSCKSGRLTVDGKPSLKKSKALIENIEANCFKGDYIRLKGKGSYNDGYSDQGFKVDLRIKKDSIIWLELADPFVGIKAARGFITQDSVIFINKIQNTYTAGSLDQISKEINAKLDFELLQNAILGQTLRKINQKENHQMSILEKAYGLYYLPKNDPLFSFGQPNYYFEIEPNQYQIMQQTATDGGNRFFAQYSDYKELRKKTYLPTKVQVEIAFNNHLKLQLQFNTVEIDEQLKFPLKISSKYQRIEN